MEWSPGGPFLSTGLLALLLVPASSGHRAVVPGGGPRLAAEVSVGSCLASVTIVLPEQSFLFSGLDSAGPSEGSSVRALHVKKPVSVEGQGCFSVTSNC